MHRFLTLTSAVFAAICILTFGLGCAVGSASADEPLNLGCSSCDGYADCLGHCEPCVIEYACGCTCYEPEYSDDCYCVGG
jgi:hypothetical protein